MNKQYCEIKRYGYENTLKGAYICLNDLKKDYPKIPFIITFNKLNNGFCVVGLTNKTIYA